MYIKQRELFKKMKAKHDEDGEDSPLTAFFEINGIDLELDATKGEEADAFELARAKNSGMSENATQVRNKDYNPVEKHLKAGGQFLKSMNVNNTNAVLDWGLPLVAGTRFDWPADYLSMVEIFGEYKTKSDSYAAGTSPIQPFLNANDIILANDATAIGRANTNNTLSVDKAAEAENDTQRRGTKWDGPWSNVHKTGDFLMKLFPNNPKKLYEYGYEVDDSPQTVRERTSSLLPEGQKTVSSIVIGCTFKNNGAADVDVYKGKTTAGERTRVLAGATLVLLPGHSTITVVNTSSTLACTFSFLRH